MKSILTAVALFACTLLQAQVIDQSFGTKSYLISNAKTESSQPEITYPAIFPKSHVVLPDGSVVFGLRLTTYLRYNWGGTGGSGMVVGKLKPNGLLDSSFGINGYFFYQQNEYQELHSLQVDPDGKILSCGYNYQTGTTIFRLKTNGDLDSSFGVNGVAQFNNNTQENQIIRRSDGKYWVAAIYYGSSTDYIITNVLNSNGTIDASYGTKYHPTTYYVENYDLIIDAADNLTVFASRSNNNVWSLISIRVLTSGTPDPANGVNGIYTFSNIPSKRLIKSISLANNKSMLLVGGNDDSAYLFRVKPVAGLDSSFGRNGIYTIKTNSDRPVPLDMYLRNDSTILVSTYSYYNSTNKYVFAVKPASGIDSTYGVLGIFNSTTGGLITGNATQTVVWGRANDGSIAFGRINFNGTTDAGYGTSGISTVVFKGSKETLGSVVKQSDGKILIGGSIRWLTYTTEPQGCYLKRFLSNGDPDLSYGTNGVAFNKDANKGGIEDMVILSDNSVITAAAKVIRKFKVNGSPDSSFATNGVFDLLAQYPTLSGFQDFTGVVKLLVQPDGKILYTGYTYVSPAMNLMMGRLNVNGSPDNTFGTNGLSTILLSPGGMIGKAMALTSDQKILVAVTSTSSSVNTYVDVLKLNSNGTVDATFGSGGKITYSELSTNRVLKPNDITILPDNSFLVLALRAEITMSGGFPGPYKSGSILHYSASGVRDMSYGISGLAPVVGSAYSIKQESSGKIILASLKPRSDLGSNNSQVLTISRYKTNGKADSTFGVNGHFILTRFSFATSEWFGNNEQVYYNPMPAILVPEGNNNYLAAGTFSFRMSDAIMQRISVADTLPAELLSLIDTLGATSCNPVKFYWRTSNEKSTNFFYLERSSDGINYTTVATINAGINTSGITTYNYNYTVPDSLNYLYRIRLSNTKGEVIYSNSISRKLQPPPGPAVTPSGSLKLCPGNIVTLQTIATGNLQWYNNGTAITGATSTSYSAAAAGAYSLRILAPSCNSAFSNIVTVTNGSVPVANAGNDISICQGNAGTIGSTAVAGNIYSWTPSTGLSFSTVAQPTASPAMTTLYILTVTSSDNCIKKDTVQVTVIPTPVTPSITAGGNILTSSAPAGNQWYKDGIAIAGAVNQTLTVTANGNYTVKTTINGCTSAVSNTITVTATAINSPELESSLVIGPIPFYSRLTIRNDKPGKLEASFSDINGKLLFSMNFSGSCTVNTESWAKGSYIIIIRNLKSGERYQRIIVKQ